MHLSPDADTGVGEPSRIDVCGGWRGSGRDGPPMTERALRRRRFHHLQALRRPAGVLVTSISGDGDDDLHASGVVAGFMTRDLKGAGPF